MFPVLLPLFASLACSVLATPLPSALEHKIIESRQTSSNSCVSGVHIVVGPGWSAGGPGKYGQLKTTVKLIQETIPQSNNYILGPYEHPATYPYFVPDTAAEEVQMRQYLSDYSTACPDTWIVLLGTSAGGVTALNTLCGASPAPPWPATTPLVGTYKFLALVVYGEETFLGGTSFDQGTCKNSAPHPRTDISACSDFFPYMQDYSDEDDPQSCNGGTNQTVHSTYNERYDAQVAAFLYNTYQNRGERSSHRSKSGSKSSS